MHQRPRKSHRLFRILFIGLSLLLLFVLASVVTEIAATDVRAKLDNARRLERDLGQLLSTLQDAETGQRGYLLTRRESYLQPYQNALDTVGPILARIGQEVMTDSLQQARVTRVRQLTAEKFRELSHTISLMSDGDTTALNQIVFSDWGKEVMDQTRSTIDLLRATENADVATRQGQLRRLTIITIVLRSLGVLGLILVFYYIYALLRPLYNTLAETNEALELKNRELDQFAHTASHDLHEPLRTVRNYVEVLDEDYGDDLDEVSRSYLTVIHRATVRMQGLIENLLVYSRAGRPGQLARVDLNQTVREVLENLELSIRESSASVTVGQLPTVDGYAISLRQLLQNLVANALKFHLPGQPPRIAITGEQNQRATYLRVQDHGIGMTAEDQGKIFELFTRLHSETDYAGQGIGLAFCQKIVHLHKGTLTVVSEPGLGSTFTVTLPRTLPNDPAKLHTTHR